MKALLTLLCAALCLSLTWTGDARANKCKDFYHKFCKKNADCKGGYKCHMVKGCVSSTCRCDPKTGRVGPCKPDCRKGGVCRKIAKKPPTAKTFFSCTGKAKSTTFKLWVGHNKVVLSLVQSDGKKARHLFSSPQRVWDGHKSGLITAKGLSIKYESHYGCIKHVVLTTRFYTHGHGSIQTVKLPLCQSKQRGCK